MDRVRTTTDDAAGVLTARPLAVGLLCLGIGAVIAAGAAYRPADPVDTARLVPLARAQIGGERGIAPINSSQDFAVGGVQVDVIADGPNDARMKGWRQAQRDAWKTLYRQLNRTSGAPTLSDGALDGIVSAIVVERESIGPRRYIASLGVLFDKARAGQLLGVSGRTLRSPPLLVLPVYSIAGLPQVFETRSPWQRAWAEYRTGDSAIDYVRTSGNGVDTLLLNSGQMGRRSRKWWRVILDQYGAADVLIPVARIDMPDPAGPIRGTFAARYGPDSELLGSFTMTGPSPAALPDMMKKGVDGINAIYARALAEGRLRPDPSLVIEKPVENLEALKAAAAAAAAAADVAKKADTADGARPGADDDRDDAPALSPAPDAPAPIAAFSLQYPSPDAASVSAIERAVAGVPGVVAASTNSLALGGTSVLAVGFRGDAAALKAALQARGFTVSGEGSTMRISR